jgi:hypothetical protein
MTAIAAGLIAGGVWHYRDPFPAAMYPRITAWIVGGGLTSTGMGAVSLYVGSEVVTAVELLESLHLLATMGLFLGLVFGTLEARVTESADAAARAETLEAERERLRILNDLLRHYVLNGVSVIGGRADLLADEVGPEAEESAQVIRDRANRIADIVERISILTKTQWRTETEIRADLEPVFRRAVRDTCAPDTDLEFEAALPPMLATVGFEDGIELLVEGLGDMLESGGQVTIGTDRSAGAITVAVRPVDVPPNLRDELLQPVASSTALELYLAKKLLEPAVELRVLESGSDEIRFALRGEFAE